MCIGISLMKHEPLWWEMSYTTLSLISCARQINNRCLFRWLSLVIWDGHHRNQDLGSLDLGIFHGIRKICWDMGSTYVLRQRLGIERAPGVSLMIAPILLPEQWRQADWGWHHRSSQGNSGAGLPFVVCVALPRSGIHLFSAEEGSAESLRAAPPVALEGCGVHLGWMEWEIVIWLHLKCDFICIFVCYSWLFLRKGSPWPFSWLWLLCFMQSEQV